MVSKNSPLLDDEEAALWKAREDTGSPRARERLFEMHADFARSIAKRHYRNRTRGGDLDFQDVQQLAYAGLLEALDRYEPEHGVPFRPFAAHRITGSIRDGLARMSEMREQIAWRHRARRERMQSLNASGHGADAPGTLEKLTEIVMGLAIGFMLEGTGLFLSENEQEEARAASPNAYDTLAWKEVTQQLRAQLSALPERERCILHGHYMDGMGFDELSTLLRISKGRVSQIHRAALGLLCKRMAQNGHFRL